MGNKKLIENKGILKGNKMNKKERLNYAKNFKTNNDFELIKSDHVIWWDKDYYYNNWSDIRHSKDALILYKPLNYVFKGLDSVCKFFDLNKHNLSTGISIGTKAVDDLNYIGRLLPEEKDLSKYTFVNLLH